MALLKPGLEGTFDNRYEGIESKTISRKWTAGSLTAGSEAPYIVNEREHISRYKAATIIKFFPLPQGNGLFREVEPPGGALTSTISSSAEIPNSLNFYLQ